MDLSLERYGKQNPTVSSFPGLATVLAAGFAAVVSVAVQGFDYGNNNFFHVPLVLNWANDPVFADDAFIQSLRNFASGLWLLVGFLATERYIEETFLVLHVVTRWVMLLSLLVAAGPLDRTRSLLLLGLLATTPLLLKGTLVGYAELFAQAFSHTQLAQAFAMLAIALMARGHVVAGMALIGVTFDVNAFVAVWTGAAALAIAISLTSVYDWRQTIRKMTIGASIAFVIALPVAWWIFEALNHQQHFEPFDYISYLWSYFPNHMLIAAATTKGLAILFSVVISGIVGTYLIGSRPLRAAFLGLCLVFVVGVFLPELTHSSTLLNLHLLRVDGLLHFITILVLGIGAINALVSDDNTYRFAGLGAVIVLCMGSPMSSFLIAAAILSTMRESRLYLIIAALAVCFTVLGTDYTWPRQIFFSFAQIALLAVAILLRLRTSPVKISQRAAAIASVAIIAVTAIVGYSDSASHRRNLEQALNQIEEIAEWARLNTDPQSVFLIPPGAYTVSTPFQLGSRRKVWVDRKRGAAVMWMPSYYHEWSARLAELSALVTDDDKITYACQNRIDYIVAEGSAAGPWVFSNASYHVIDVHKTGRCSG